MRRFWIIEHVTKSDRVAVRGAWAALVLAALLGLGTAAHAGIVGAGCVCMFGDGSTDTASLQLESVKNLRELCEAIRKDVAGLRATRDHYTSADMLGDARACNRVVTSCGEGGIRVGRDLRAKGVKNASCIGE